MEGSVNGLILLPSIVNSRPCPAHHCGERGSIKFIKYGILEVGHGVERLQILPDVYNCSVD
jgi:hypothetical protein